jgi:hypothetical protein
VEVDPVLSKELESFIQRSNLERGGFVCRNIADPLQGTTGTTEVTSFDWISSWIPASKLAHGGRASLAYLKEHLEENSSIHMMLD